MLGNNYGIQIIHNNMIDVGKESVIDCYSSFLIIGKLCSPNNIQPKSNHVLVTQTDS